MVDWWLSLRVWWVVSATDANVDLLKEKNIILWLEKYDWF
jgi:hypothetical protein